MSSLYVYKVASKPRTFLIAPPNVKDRGNTTVEIMADLREILQEVKSEPQWNQTKFAVASSCDEPSWARECIRLISIGTHSDPKSKLSFGKSGTYLQGITWRRGQRDFNLMKILIFLLFCVLRFS